MSISYGGWAEFFHLRRFNAGPISSAWYEARKGARDFSRTTDPLRLLQGAVVTGDALAIIFASLTAFRWQHSTWVEPVDALSVTLLMAALVAVIRRGADVASHGVATYRFRFGRAASLCCFLFLPLFLLTWLSAYPPAYWRSWVPLWWAGALGGVLLVRLFAHWQARKWAEEGRLARVVAVVDIGGDGRALAREILRSGGLRTCVIGVFAAKAGESAGVDKLIRLTRAFRVDEVIVAYRYGAEETLSSVVKALAIVPTNVHLYAGSPPNTLSLQGAELLFAKPVVTVSRRPLAGWGRALKRTEDLILTTLLLICFLPAIVAVVVLIKLDSRGPVLFRQKRLGFNNNEFEVLKFRTMVHEPNGDERHVPQARRRDPRVTRVGWILRRTSFDELPQLLNVLRGDMSLIGPRPHALPHNEYYAGLIDGYLGRHRVRPGITGWAQVNGFRGETDTLEKMQHRVEFDQLYIENWSLALDLKILFLTFAAVKNAY